MPSRARVAGRLEKLETLARECAERELREQARVLAQKRDRFLVLDADARRISEAWEEALAASTLMPPAWYLSGADEGSRIFGWRTRRVPAAREAYGELRRRWVETMGEPWPWHDPWWDNEPTAGTGRS